MKIIESFRESISFQQFRIVTNIRISNQLNLLLNNSVTVLVEYGYARNEKNIAVLHHNIDDDFRLSLIRPS